MAKLSIFEHLNNLTTGKVAWDEGNDEQTKGYSPYIVSRWISMCEFYIPVVEAMNRYNIPKDVHYNYFLDSLPKRKQYFKYHKKPKSEDMSAEDKGYLYDYFEIGPRQLGEYLEIIPDEEISSILSMYKDSGVQ